MECQRLNRTTTEAPLDQQQLPPHISLSFLLAERGINYARVCVVCAYVGISLLAPLLLYCCCCYFVSVLGEINGPTTLCNLFRNGLRCCCYLARVSCVSLPANVFYSLPAVYHLPPPLFALRLLMIIGGWRAADIKPPASYYVCVPKKHVRILGCCCYKASESGKSVLVP